MVLKGGAFLLQDLACARGRLFSDVDLMVPRAHLDAVEGLLREAGWRFAEPPDAYDERCYREWSHELPPFERPGHPLQLDLHHSILPPVGRALWYGVEFSGALFGTPWADELKAALAFAAPGAAARGVMMRLGARALLPESPDQLPSAAKHGARQVLFLRYPLLRLSLRLLVLHAAYEGARRFRRAPKDPAAGPADAG